VSFGGFDVGPALANAAAKKATMGSGLLQDVLVIGIAFTGTGAAVAQDATLDASNPAADEAAHFTLTLLSAGGRGAVFDGAAPGVGYKAVIQNVAGRTYNARNTPHMFVINPEGKVIYEGAIDNKATPNPNDISSSTNYVKVALDESMSGKPVSNANTRPYGCSIKYK